MKIKGIVTRTQGEPNPHGFYIKDAEENEYYAHLGDLEENEEKLYKNKDQNTVYLKKDDTVEFQVFDNTGLRGATSVKKINSTD